MERSSAELASCCLSALVDILRNLSYLISYHLEGSMMISIFIQEETEFQVEQVTFPLPFISDLGRLDLAGSSRHPSVYPLSTDLEMSKQGD